MSNKTIKVGVVLAEKAVYPTDSPYHPSTIYPEYPFHDKTSRESNYVYDALRELLHSLGYDSENYGTKYWNPFGGIIKPGMTVVIKPNFVLSRHFEGKDVYSIITHPSLIRAIADYCWIALQGEGKIIIADAPQYNCNFNELIKVTGLDKVLDFYASYSGVSVELFDLRNYWSKSLHMPSCKRKLPGDPKGSVIIKLGKNSAYYSHPNPKKYYGAVYHRQETINHHFGEKQEYEISKTILSADVLISLPKMKVHKKVGVTLNGKGLVGIATNKNLIIHYTLGTPAEGGDQFPDNLLTPLEMKIIKFERWMYDTFLSKNSILWEIPHRLIYGFIYLKLLKPLGLKVPEEKRLLDAGNWYGNDTAWRMVVDLMKIIHFADSNGIIHDKVQRKIFSVVDGIIGGENKGPLVPDPKPVGVLVGGENLLAVDLVATRLMGYDFSKIKWFNYLLNNSSSDFGFKSIDEIQVISSPKEYENCLKDKSNRFFAFKPYPGWIGHIEI
jgi:uncharacterized protein (DUF362 family)